MSNWSEMDSETRRQLTIESIAKMDPEARAQLTLKNIKKLIPGAMLYFSDLWKLDPETGERLFREMFGTSRDTDLSYLEDDPFE